MKRWAVAALLGAAAISMAATLWPRRFKVLFYQFPGADKGGHFVVMGVLALVLVVTLAGSTWRGHRIGVTLCLAATLALVAVDEISQLIIPGRTFSWLDLAYSWAGVLVGGGIGALLRPRTRHPETIDRRPS